MNVAKEDNAPEINEKEVKILAGAMASWYVRKDNKFYPSDQPTATLSKEDVERASLFRMQEEFPNINLTPRLITEVFIKAIIKRHTELDQTIPVWDGTVRCSAGNDERYLWRAGTVSLNAWSKPSYRDCVPSNQPVDLIERFFEVIFPREQEREMFLDWLAWCLQNEGEKPKWAPFLYSETKGSGKSTMCGLVARLFGIKNSVTQNNVDKLVAKFNVPVLMSKLVICEELNLRPDSPRRPGLLGSSSASKIMPQTATQRQKTPLDQR